MCLTQMIFSNVTFLCFFAIPLPLSLSLSLSLWWYEILQHVILWQIILKASHEVFHCAWERTNKVYRNLVFMMFGVNECVFLDLLFFWVWCIIINIKPTPNTKYVIYSKTKTFIILQNVSGYLMTILIKRYYIFFSIQHR